MIERTNVRVSDHRFQLEEFVGGTHHIMWSHPGFSSRLHHLHFRGAIWLIHNLYLTINQFLFMGHQDLALLILPVVCLKHHYLLYSPHASRALRTLFHALQSEKLGTPGCNSCT